MSVVESIPRRFSHRADRRNLCPGPEGARLRPQPHQGAGPEPRGVGCLVNPAGRHRLVVGTTPLRACHPGRCPGTEVPAVPAGSWKEGAGISDGGGTPAGVTGIAGPGRWRRCPAGTQPGHEGSPAGAACHTGVRGRL